MVSICTETLTSQIWPPTSKKSTICSPSSLHHLHSLQHQTLSHMFKSQKERKKKKECCKRTVVGISSFPFSDSSSKNEHRHKLWKLNNCWNMRHPASLKIISCQKETKKFFLVNCGRLAVSSSLVLYRQSTNWWLDANGKYNHGCLPPTESISSFATPIV